MRRALFALPLTLGLGCGGPEPITAPSAALIPLDPPRLLRRSSLDLRGVLPSVAELDAVEADPGALDALRLAWLDDPRFEDRLVDLLAERWRTRLDHFLFPYDEYALLRDDPTLEHPFQRAVSDEPLRLMARTVSEGRPWTDILTVDHTLASPLLLSIWPLEALEEGEGWVKARYTDDRPAAGVLATSGLWIRYWTTNSNRNRGRAAAISRLLLCEDYLNRPVAFSGNTGALGTEDALRQDPYCLGCHASLDPLAATLFGFWTLVEYSALDAHSYHPEREPLYASLLDTQPALNGQPVADLAQLGEAIALDPRFARCAALSFAEGLWRRPPTLEDDAVIEALRWSFVDGGMRVKPLLIEIMETESYAAGALVEGSEESHELTTRLLSPTQLHSAVGELTGFDWTWEGFDQLDNDDIGYRVAAGGVDGLSLLSPQRRPGLTWALITWRVAQAGAWLAVEGDLVEGDGAGLDGPGLLDGVDLQSRPGDEDFDAQLEALRWRLLAVRATADDVEELSALWELGEDAGGAELGWRLVVEALLRDPLFLSY